tara:strand:+ start:333 stop:494 length:162 start_codon:yes stop_codon:yes gene_type:complete
MTEEIEQFMTEKLDIIFCVGSEPLEECKLFEDVGGNIWTLDQIIEAFEAFNNK